MRARDIMSSPVHTVLQTASVESAAQLMAATAVTALPVVAATGGLVGMVSESDLLWHRVPADPTAHLRRYPDTDPVHRPGMVVEVMSPYPLTTTPETDVAEVAETMLDHDVRSMPVLQDGALVGIISRRDILRAMVRSDDVLAREVQHRLDEYSDGGRRWTVTVDQGVATVLGEYVNETERAVVTVLARTVPGVAAVQADTRAATP
ncbi:CBS domain-containing protein [Actinoplanes sp. N902-109]|uniref:CBS domain-containing protein n=1 Tax=Actinoplanes sp. (strain N902-109) TaxID=649831 RepID=UPI0003294F11|nr:CBS domain-containing protein [Actinoplanes sp. N902-109]AGL16950.1 putative signal-transduction protein containing cAMP-binding and CBS domains [Actinoplanes sp. N902-109]